MLTCSNDLKGLAKSKVRHQFVWTKSFDFFLHLFSRFGLPFSIAMVGTWYGRFLLLIIIVATAKVPRFNALSGKRMATLSNDRTKRIFRIWRKPLLSDNTQIVVFGHGNSICCLQMASCSSLGRKRKWIFPFFSSLHGSCRVSDIK